MPKGLSVGELITICAALGGLILWVIHTITDPLQQSLENINKTLERLNALIDEQRKEQSEMLLKIKELEDVTLENRRRIENLERG